MLRKDLKKRLDLGQVNYKELPDVQCKKVHEVKLKKAKDMMAKVEQVQLQSASRLVESAQSYNQLGAPESDVASNDDLLIGQSAISKPWDQFKKTKMPRKFLEGENLTKHAFYHTILSQDSKAQTIRFKNHLKY